ncbi:MAG: hypothetical protein J07HQW1_01566 [Haloquadratum walsbyi J07HQW1]|jgi:hypothetical protein|uniref:Ig-like domain-containing protein n=1 Tax=Haloquadratum walsbyi J07HQW1 TaxID=1238424 RepID=U1PD78_9EURY|nr:MAG: hypothetical protein J07HQW1_01566 [Haloquadratum walsbyi J07HQW1]
MPTQNARVNAGHRFGCDTTSSTQRQQNDEQTLVIRNYDASEIHTIHVQVHDTGGKCVLERTLQVNPSRAVTMNMCCDAATYTITAQIETGSVDMTECRIGTSMDKTALIETGNGSVRVADGLV